MIVESGRFLLKPFHLDIELTNVLEDDLTYDQRVLLRPLSRTLAKVSQYLVSSVSRSSVTRFLGNSFARIVTKRCNELLGSKTILRWAAADGRRGTRSGVDQQTTELLIGRWKSKNC